MWGDAIRDAAGTETYFRKGSRRYGSRGSWNRLPYRNEVSLVGRYALWRLEITSWNVRVCPTLPRGQARALVWAWLRRSGYENHGCLRVTWGLGAGPSPPSSNLNTPVLISSNSHDEEGVRVAVGAILERTMLWASCSILLWAHYL